MIPEQVNEKVNEIDWQTVAAAVIITVVVMSALNFVIKKVA